MKENIAAFLIRFVLRAVRLFWRVRYINRPDDKHGSHLYAHWHGDELILLPVFSHRHYAVMSSRSRDGELMTKVLRSLGFEVVRGSSSRGGAGGLKGLVDLVLQKNLNAALSVDGPRGPLHQVKPGILFLSQSTGLPIYPAAAASSRRWKIPGAWNEGYIPKPFSRCLIVFGEPLQVPQECSEQEWDQIQNELQTRLVDLKTRAEAEV